MIRVTNARLIDNVSSASYLASLLLEKACGKGSGTAERHDSESAFSNLSEYRILKIVRQDGFQSADDIRIEHPGSCSDGPDRICDFNGDYLFPSFVDFHCHSEFLYLKDPSASMRRNDLISDEVVGNCGVSIYPISADSDGKDKIRANVLSILGEWPDGLTEWNSFADFKHVFDSMGVCNSLRFLQGHSALRISAMKGNPNRKADGKEIVMMQKLLDDSLSSGAIGFSTGLYYAPCIFADDREILALLEIVRQHDGIFAIHRREEGNRGIEATAEAISYAKKARVRLQISHLKAIGDANQCQVDGILSMIDRAHEDGLDIAFDQYPYVYGSTSLASLLPPQVLKDGEKAYKLRLVEDRSYRENAKRLMMNPVGFESIAQLVSHDKISIQYSDSFPQFMGKSVSQIASMRNEDEIDAILDIIALEEGICTMRDVTQSEENLIRIMSHPLSLYCTDALFAGKEWHDRSRNASRHMLRSYSGSVGIENLVRRATSASAERLRLDDRKVVKEGETVRLVRFRL